MPKKIKIAKCIQATYKPHVLYLDGQRVQIGEELPQVLEVVLVQAGLSAADHELFDAFIRRKAVDFLAKMQAKC